MLHLDSLEPVVWHIVPSAMTRTNGGPPALRWHVPALTLLCTRTQWMSDPPSPSNSLSHITFIHQLLLLFWHISQILAHSFFPSPVLLSFCTVYAFASLGILLSDQWHPTAAVAMVTGDSWKHHPRCMDRKSRMTVERVVNRERLASSQPEWKHKRKKRERKKQICNKFHCVLITR